MSTTQLNIANMAIYDVGGNPITDIPDGNQLEGLLVNQFWGQALDEVLESHPWRPFKTPVALTEDAAYTFVDDTYEYAYEIPSDWVRPVELENHALNYELRGDVNTGRILSNIEDMEIIYIARPTVATVSTALYWPAYFVKALTAKLAEKLSLKLVKKGSDKKDWERRYLKELAIAQMADANQDRPSNYRRIKHSADTDSWIQSRG
jgi:hypothetical protein